MHANKIHDYKMTSIQKNRKKNPNASSQLKKADRVADEQFKRVAEDTKDAIVYIETIRAPILTLPWRLLKFFTGSKSATLTKLHSLYSRIQSDMPDDKPKIGVSGTGFFIENDLIVTNIHVVAHAHTIAAKQIKNNEIILYSIIGVTGYDPTNDLVVLKVDKKSNTSLPIRSSDQVQDGDKVCILTYADAIYSCINGKISNIGAASQYHTIETALSPGNSGSPVLDDKGEVIGIANSIIRSLKSEYTNINLANAIHSNILISILKNPIATEHFVTWLKRPDIHAYRINLQGDRKLYKKKYDEAINKYDLAIRKNPNLVRTYINRSNAKIKLFDYDGAISDTNIATKLYPDLLQTYLIRVAAQLSKFELNAALKEIEKAFEKFSQDVQIFKLYFVRSAIHAALGNLETAVEDIDKAISIKPDYAEAYCIRANIKTELDDFQDALENCDKAVEINPKLEMCFSIRADVKCQYAQFLSEYTENDSVLDIYQEAFEDAQKAIQIDPDSTAVFYSRGKSVQHIAESHAEKGEIDKAKELYNAAIADYTKSVQLKPSSPSAYHGRGWSKYLLGKLETNNGNERIAKKHFNTAIVDCDEAIRLSKGTYISYKYHHLLGNIKAALGNYNEAIRDYTAAIKLNPRHKKSYQDRSQANQILGNKVAEKNDFAIEKELNIDISTYWLGVGKKMYYKSDYITSIKYLDIALKLNSQLHNAYNFRGMSKSALGRAEMKKNNHENAKNNLNDGIADYTKGLKIKPKCSTCHSNRGNAKYSLGMCEFDNGNKDDSKAYFNQAIEDLEIAIDIDPMNYKARRIRGNVRKELGFIIEAEEDYKKADKLEKTAKNKR